MDRLVHIARTLGLLLVAGLLVLWSGGAIAQTGAVNTLHYDVARNALEIRGWAWNAISKQGLDTLHVQINGAPAVLEGFHTIERPDLALRFPEAASLPIGFVATAMPAKRLSAGWSQVQVEAVFPDGSRFTVMGVSGEMLRFHVQRTPVRHWLVLMLVLVGVGMAYAPAAQRLTRRGGAWIQAHHQRVFGGIGIVFLVLVSVGVTGSALSKLERSPIGQDVMDVVGTRVHLFKLRVIRGDEGAILVPSALAQLQHEPQFPVVNTHLGLDGQNMGVIGMTGVPIAQAAAIARPATWGYFFLPLRQALSWQWNLPFFACLAALWVLLNAALPGAKGFNLLLAASFCLAPYAAAWSNWPLYAVLFPIGGLIAFFALLRTRRASMGVALGVVLGWLLVAWALVLYPPWQISVGTLAVLLAAGHVLDQRGEVLWGRAQLLGVLTALAVTVLLLGSWWHDTQSAVAQVNATIYPGQRSTLTGGDESLAWFLRGFTNAETLSFGTGPASNESELSSYFFLPWILVGLGLWRGARPTPYRWRIAACLLFIGFALWYSFIGLPAWLSALTLWGRVPTGRIDLALGLACTLLLALIRGDPGERLPDHATRLKSWPMALVLAALSGALVTYAMSRLPKEVFSRDSLVYQAAILIASSFMAWWLLRGRMVASAGMLVLLCSVSVAGFNSISIAPQSITLSAPARQFLVDTPTTAPAESVRFKRTLLVGSGETALQLTALGVPTVNGIFYYPQPSLWRLLKLDASDWPTVNRYQHLDFRLAHLPTGPTYQVSTERIDQVAVTVDAQRFDFSSTGAERVLARGDDDASALRDNSSLREIGQHGQLLWFDVVRPAP